MDEMIDLIVSGTKYQNYQTIIGIFFVGMNSLFFYLNPFLFKNPILSNQNNNNSSKNITLNELCFINNSMEYIDHDKSIDNYSIIYNFFCLDEIWALQVLIIIYFVSKIIGSFTLGYLIDKYGRKIFLDYGIIMTFTSFLFLFLGIFSYNLLLIGMILVGICSFFLTFSSILTCEYLSRNKGGTICSLNIISGILLASILLLILILFNNLMIVLFIVLISQIILRFYIKKYFMESPHFLIGKNRINDCINVISKFAELNDKQNLYNKIYDQSKLNEVPKPLNFTANIIDIFNYESQRNRLILHSLLWVFSSISYHNIFIHLEKFIESDDYIKYYLIIFLICILTQLSVGILSDNIGRQHCLTYSFYINSISFIIFCLIEEKLGIKNILFFIATSASSSTFVLLFIFSGEDFPTCIRGTVIGFLFGISQLTSLIGFFIENQMILCIIISLSNCIGGRIMEAMEDTFDLIIDDTLPEMYKNSKKKFRSLKCEQKSSGSDLYFLTSDDEAFNREMIYI